MNENQKAKRRFRQSKLWKQFRHQKNVEQKGLDPITGRKLPAGANLHHRHVTANNEEYCDISKPEEYVMLGITCHKMLHFIYQYWKNDPAILDRIREEFEKWY